MIVLRLFCDLSIAMEAYARVLPAPALRPAQFMEFKTNNPILDRLIEKMPFN